MASNRESAWSDWSDQKFVLQGQLYAPSPPKKQPPLVVRQLECEGFETGVVQLGVPQRDMGQKYTDHRGSTEAKGKTITAGLGSAYDNKSRVLKIPAEPVAANLADRYEGGSLRFLEYVALKQTEHNNVRLVKFDEAGQLAYLQAAHPRGVDLGGGLFALHKDPEHVTNAGAAFAFNYNVGSDSYENNLDSVRQAASTVSDEEAYEVIRAFAVLHLTGKCLAKDSVLLHRHVGSDTQLHSRLWREQFLDIIMEKYSISEKQLITLLLFPDFDKICALYGQYLESASRYGFGAESSRPLEKMMACACMLTFGGVPFITCRRTCLIHEADYFVGMFNTVEPFRKREVFVDPLPAEPAPKKRSGYAYRRYREDYGKDGGFYFLLFFEKALPSLLGTLANQL